MAGSTLVGSIGRRRVPAVLAWGSVAAVMIVPVAIAAFSPYLASRNMPYIVGGFAGIVGLSLLFLKPLLPASAPARPASMNGLSPDRPSTSAFRAQA